MFIEWMNENKSKYKWKQSMLEDVVYLEPQSNDNR